MVEVLHVVIAGRLEIDEHGNFAAKLVEGLKIEGHAGAASDGREVYESIRRAADGLQDHHGIADGGWGDELAGARRAADGHLRGALAAGFGDAAAFGVYGGCSCA